MTNPRSRPARWGALLALAAVTVAAYAGVAAWVMVVGPRAALAHLLPLLLLLAVPACAAAAFLPRLPAGRGALIVLFAAALLARVPFFFTSPLLSDDVYRYLWDGHVQTAGFSPYGIAPDDARLDGVERSGEPVRPLVNHPEIPTIYPPLLEEIFWGVARIGGGLATWRALLLGVDLAIGFFLARGLAWRGSDPRLAVLYLWHPLPVIESIWSAHTEAIAVLFLLAAVYALARGWRWRAAGALGLGGAAKLLPFGMLPALGRRAGFFAAAAAIGIAGLTALPYAGTDLHAATAGLRAYGESWYFNDILYRPIGWLIGLHPQDKTLLSTAVLRLAMAGAWVVVCVLAAWRVRDPWRGALWIAGAFVLLTPTLHPWYLLWVLPFAIARGNSAWLLLSVTVLASYVAEVCWRESGVWLDLAAVRLLEFTPPALLFLWSMLRRGTSSPSGTSARPE